MRKTLRVLWSIILLLGSVHYLFSSTETTFHNFAGGTDGSDPLADLIYSPASGIVYGTTKTGGGSPNCTKGCGTVFSLLQSGTGYTVVYRFAGGANDGANPQAGLTTDANGNLYGTTYNGGAHNLGTIFKLTPIGGGQFSESILHSFSGPDGAHPLAKLVLGASGILYGTTFGGGAHGLGAVFELFPSGGESVVFSFTAPTGSRPRAGVVLDSAGDLWGTTSLGGGANLGTVFRLTFNGNTWSETFLHSFTGVDGANPYAALTLDTKGDVFGTARTGGSPACTFAAAGCGVVFEFQPSGTGFIENTIYAFTGGSDGAAPVGDVTLALDSAGDQYLYGTASQAGVIGGTCPAIGCGTLFELCGIGSSCQGSLVWTEYTVFDFLGRNGGRTPAAGVLVFLPVGTNESLMDFPPRGRGGCTSGCMTAPSSGGTSGNGTVDGVAP
jgi:uncharacterized repeat protein (TIGR03803 family)